MRANSVLILIVAIVMGGIAAFLARNWMLSRTQVSTAANATIMAASKAIPFGTPLGDDNVREIPWAAGAIPEGSFPSKEALFKEGRRIALSVIQPNEPILKSRITGPGERASLSTLLSKDMRAITIRVDDVRGVAGFIFPNDRVDVVLNRTVPNSSSGRREVSDLLLQDVKVIAVDQISSEQKEKATIAKAVTLEVTPFQAQKISLATTVGSLSLILRKAGDSNVVADRRVTEADLNASEAAMRVVPPPPPPAPKASAVSVAPKKVEPPPIVLSPDMIVSVERNFRSEDYKVGTMR
jgi:pilus assembly protein CpaB